ncbi:hypothetical protein AA309_22820 [Microvirga vignae]|uniref:Uncharacterized protein n=1 Tax=Microvirga vignae TaxID=1225564 RepID=A0A0H1R842_9HYPH|nr:hypothetical protein [Microvirga vignae]KLK91011.1 hypothetical protein AA309_22820 [Microvirga vignae]
MAEECLLKLQQDLWEWRAHRQFIIDTIKRSRVMRSAQRQVALTADLAASVARVVEKAGPQSTCFDEDKPDRGSDSRYTPTLAMFIKNHIGHSRACGWGRRTCVTVAGFTPVLVYRFCQMI